MSSGCGRTLELTNHNHVTTFNVYTVTSRTAAAVVNSSQERIKSHLNKYKTNGQLRSKPIKQVSFFEFITAS